MNVLTKQLIQELYSTSSVTESRVLQLFVRGIETAAASSTEDIFEQTLNDLVVMNEKLKDAEVDTVVKKFKKMADTPAKKLKAADAKVGVKDKLKKIKESAGSYADPILKSVIANFEGALNTNSESAVVESVINGLKPFAFDPVISSAVSELSTWVSENRAELAILNTIN